jgi:D-alanine transaminase
VGRRNTEIKINDEMSDIVYLNGNFLSKNKAFISPEDRGFNFADGIYEVVKYYKGRPFRMEDHLERLARSLHEIKISFSVDYHILKIFAQLLSLNGLSKADAGIYIQITRGSHQRVHHFPANLEPTVYAFAFPFPSFTEMLDKGIMVTTAEDIRWLRCDIKSVSLLPNTMLYNEAVENGAGECILVRNGKVTEATHSSVFGVKDGIVITHPLSNLILPGITRKVVLEICSTNEIPNHERAIAEDELEEMDELFIAGTGSEIMPVVKVNDNLVGNGKPGPVTRQLQQLFFEAIGK